jgi:hypothetical protein
VTTSFISSSAAFCEVFRMPAMRFGMMPCCGGVRAGLIGGARSKVIYFNPCMDMSYAWIAAFARAAASAAVIPGL